MKMMILFIAVLFSSVLYGQLTIEVKNVSSSKGKIMLGIYNAAGKFPKQNATFKNVVVKAKKGITKIVITDLPKGNYAIAVYHDANGNQTLDKNMFGVPTEFYGFSNDARETFSAPSFESAKLEFDGNLTTSITIK